MSRGLAIVGHGKMGRLIEQLAPEYGFEVRAKFTREHHLHDGAVTRKGLQGVDVAIEFSTPDSAPDNLRRLASLSVDTVCGTTGWFEHLPAVH
jgi:4-hydroxy-tetrahydrodipicolinate reductase